MRQEGSGPDLKLNVEAEVLVPCVQRSGRGQFSGSSVALRSELGGFDSHALGIMDNLSF